MFLNITFALLIGGLVGVVGHIRKEGKWSNPEGQKNSSIWGVFEEVIMGALAAVFLVVSSDPDSALKVVLLAVIAGFGGDALLTCLDFLKIRHKE